MKVRNELAYLPLREVNVIAREASFSQYIDVKYPKMSNKWSTAWLSFYAHSTPRLILIGYDTATAQSSELPTIFLFYIIKTFQKSLDDRPKCSQVLLQTSMEIFVHPQINVKYENHIFTITRLVHAETQQIGCLHPCFHGQRIW